MAPFMAGLEKPYAGEHRNFGSKHQRREIISEHAATLGCLGRLVVARQVMRGEITPSKKAGQEQRQEQYRFGPAYDLARSGTNQYYAANIAVQGARAERANGRLPSVWAMRAAASVGRALIRDPGRLKDAVGTVVKTGWQARSRRAAIAAAQDWRTV